MNDSEFMQALVSWEAAKTFEKSTGAHVLVLNPETGKRGLFVLHEKTVHSFDKPSAVLAFMARLARDMRVAA